MGVNTEAGRASARKPSEEELNLRSERRLPCDVTKVNLFTNDAEKPIAGEVLDISVNGLRIRTEAMIAVGCAVKIDFQKHLLSGEVRFCRPDETGGFQVGLQIIEFSAV